MINDFKHNDIRDKLADIGAFLGFDPGTEQKIAEGSIDSLMVTPRRGEYLFAPAGDTKPTQENRLTDQ
jgi:hypothetical protein